jgi:hypothetical protein
MRERIGIPRGRKEGTDSMFFYLNGFINNLASNHSSFDVTGVSHHVTIWQINTHLKGSTQLIYRLQNITWMDCE